MGVIWADAVFEGGGVKGIGLAGALEVMEAAGYRWKRLAGASAGAVIAALVAAGYTGAELRQILEQVDYERFKDRGRVDAIPFLGPVLSLLAQKGIYEGDFLEGWIRELLARRGIKTFGDLRCDDGGLYEHRLQLLVSDVTRGRILIVPSGLREYEIDPDSFDVARAVRMSASLPFFFEPVQLDGSYFVDGGMLSNFPVWLFDRPASGDRASEPIPRWPTIGFKLVEPEDGLPNETDSTLGFVKALVTTMLDSHDKKHVEEVDYLRTIGIPTMGVRTTEFSLSRERQNLLYTSGCKAAHAFLEHWDHATYVSRVRVPTTEQGKRARERYRAVIQERSRRMIGSRVYPHAHP
jgi:NTE family protein